MSLNLGLQSCRTYITFTKTAQIEVRQSIVIKEF